MFSFVLWLILSAPPQPVLNIATTTSVENTGLMDALISVFEAEHSITVRYVAVGTGQALRLGRDGNVDLIFVHDSERENLFIREGHGTKRYEIMKNYFTVIGPPEYRDKIETGSLCDLLSTILSENYRFVSRGDDSGTHSRERSLWKTCDLKPSGNAYLETGSGMTATLRVANEKTAFTLTDMATYLAHQDEVDLLPYLKEGPSLLNIYSLIPVNPEEYPDVQYDLALMFIQFTREGKGKDIIRTYGEKEFGQLLFTQIMQ